MNTANMPTKQDVIAMPERVAEDERGVIEKLGKGNYQSVLRITSKKGTVRANHYHKWDSHLCYLTRGRIRYVERPAGDEKAPLTEYIIKPGQLFYTAPMVSHAMEFLEDSEFFAFTPRSAKQEEYEEDVTRVVLIDPAEAAARAKKE